MRHPLVVLTTLLLPGVMFPTLGYGGPNDAGYAGVVAKLAAMGVLLTPAPPSIESELYSATVTPGAAIYLRGQNFLAPDGTGGQLLLNLGTVLPIVIQNVLSSDQGLGAIIPDDITGVPDTPATLQILRSDGVLGNKFPVQFIAKREFVRLPSTDVQVTCSQGGDFNSCPSYPDDYSISANHMTYWGHDSDTDQFISTLANGWVFNYLYNDPQAQQIENGAFVQQGAIEGPQGFVPDSTTTHIYVHWANDPGGLPTTTFGGDVQYGMQIYIYGPRGVPWK
jgi:hypothetical protein